MKLKTSPRVRVTAHASWESAEMPAAARAGFNLKTLLVPVDFSPCSRKALLYAVSFAKQFNAQIHLLHAVQTLPPMAEMPPGFLATESIFQCADLRDQAIKHLVLWSKSIKTRKPIRAMVENGAPSDVIARIARVSEADMIIIGTHGKSRLEQFFLGSTARSVVQHAPCPVLVVREEEHDFLPSVDLEVVASKKPKHRKRPPVSKN